MHPFLVMVMKILIISKFSKTQFLQKWLWTFQNALLDIHVTTDTPPLKKCMKKKRRFGVSQEKFPTNQKGKHLSPVLAKSWNNAVDETLFARRQLKHSILAETFVKCLTGKPLQLPEST